MNKKIRKKSNLLMIIHMIYLILLIGFFTFIYMDTYRYNNVLHTVGEKDTYVEYEIYGRGGPNDAWTKNSVTGHKVLGKIFEVSIKNYGNGTVSNWSLRIDIDKKCWINNSWNGSLEIHQFINGEERVQTLHLLDVGDTDIILDYFYDGGDIMISLNPGDYFIYYPSKEMYEDPILKHNGKTTFGIIMYTKYLSNNDIDISQTKMSFNYDRRIDESPLFIPFIIACVVWFLMLAFMLISLNVEQKKRDQAYQEALKEAYDEAKRANEAKSNFLANMSHEIRTPINAILGMNTMIIRECEDPNINKYARDIDASGKTLLYLVNDILDLSKIESGKMELLPGNYDTDAAIKNVISMLKQKVNEKGLKLITQIDDKLPSKLYGDEIRIKQIIINILNNAVKYTKEGSVTLNISSTPLDGDEVLLKVKVSDTGIGIKPEDIDKLFNRFERIEEERNKNIEGTGLGMSITQKLLSLMDSKLEVASEYGKGSEFSFEIRQKVVDWTPVKKVVYENEQDFDIKKESFHAPDARILVIDDVKMNHIVITGLLKRIECKVDTCESGIEGIELSKQNKYDIIFIDHMMPEMDGIETLKHIKQECELNMNTPKIVLTANAIAGAKEEYIREGFENYLSKPVDGDELEAMITKYLSPDLIKVVSESTEENKESFLDKLNSLEELDTSEGIRYSGGEEIYKRILEIFVKDSEEESAIIKHFAEVKDFNNFTVEVHGLKSSAKTLGIKKLAKIAYELELAGKEKDEALIEEKVQPLLEEYERIVKLIKNIL